MAIRYSMAGAMICAVGLGTSIGANPSQPYHILTLNPMGMAKGEAYLTQRSVLLASHPTLWDVGEATTHSWEAGLAAFILNARLQFPEEFAVWDAATPVRTRSGRLRYVETLRFEGGTAFLIEKAWRTAETEEVRQLCLRMALGSPPSVISASGRPCGKAQTPRVLDLSPSIRSPSARTKWPERFWPNCSPTATPTPTAC